jgi:hypothetical protein
MTFAATVRRGGRLGSTLRYRGGAAADERFGELELQL